MRHIPLSYIVVLTLVFSISLSFATPTPAVQKPSVGDVFRYMRMKIDSAGKGIEGSKQTIEFSITSKDAFREGRRNLYTYRYDDNEPDLFTDVQDDGDVATLENIFGWNFWQVYPFGTKQPRTLLEKDTMNGKGLHFHVKITSAYEGSEALTTKAGNINSEKVLIVYTVTVKDEKGNPAGKTVETQHFWFAPRLGNMVKFVIQNMTYDKDGRASYLGGATQVVKDYLLK